MTATLEAAEALPHRWTSNSDLQPVVINDPSGGSGSTQVRPRGIAEIDAPGAGGGWCSADTIRAHAREAVQLENRGRSKRSRIPSGTGPVRQWQDIAGIVQ